VIPTTDCFLLCIATAGRETGHSISGRAVAERQREFGRFREDVLVESGTHCENGEQMSRVTPHDSTIHSDMTATDEALQSLSLLL
jgi:hypothetical protein